MASASIKGSLFASVVEEVRWALESGDLTRARLESALPPEDLELIDSAIVASLWYDIRAFARICTLLRDTVGGGDDSYLEDLGRASWGRLRDSGVSAQVAFLDRVSKSTEQTESSLSAQQDMGLALFRSLYDFGHWSTRRDPDHADRYMIVMSDAADMPEACVWRTLGFVNEMDAWRGEGDLWYWDRPTPDTVRLRRKQPLKQD